MKQIISVVLLFSLQALSCGLSSSAPMNFDDLTRLIRDPSCNIKSVDDVVAKLPETMRSKFALFYKSKSLQDPRRVDYLYPRAILSSASGPTYNQYKNLKPAIMVTFNGHESQAEHNKLEVVSMNAQAQDVFQYFDISFPSDAQAKSMTWSEAQLLIKVSEPNPARCVQCHGNPARPIFQAYPTWEGAYGSQHTKGLTNEEAQGLENFKQTHSTTPNSRYRHLNPNRIYDFHSRMCSQLLQVPKINDPLCFNSAEQTIRIFQDLADYNTVRGKKLIQSQPYFQYSKFAVASALFGCEKMRNTLPDDVFSQLKKNQAEKIQYSKIETDQKALPLYKKYLAESEFGDFGDIDGSRIGYVAEDQVINPEELIEKDKKYWNDEFLFGLWIDTIEKQGPSRSISDTVWLRLIVQGLGGSMENWWMDLKQSTYRENHGVATGISYHLFETDPDISPDYNEYLKVIYSHDQVNQRYEKAKKIFCESMADKSQRALKGFKVPSLSFNPTVPASAFSVIQKSCIRCHVAHPVGPPLPFGSEVEFRQWLSVGNNAKKIRYRVFQAPELNQMPPTQDLSREEKKVLNEFLNQFIQ